MLKTIYAKSLVTESSAFAASGLKAAEIAINPSDISIIQEKEIDKAKAFVIETKRKYIVLINERGVLLRDFADFLNSDNSIIDLSE